MSRPASQPLALCTGWPALDAALGGGWPVGELTEIVGRGRCSLALGAVRAAQADGRPVGWVDGPGVFCPATARVDLAALTLVRPRGVRSSALFAAELLLRSRAFALLVLDAEPGRDTLSQWFRLARQARVAESALLLLGAPGATRAGSAAGCTLRVSLCHAETPDWAPLGAASLAVRLLRRRGAAVGGACLHLGPG